MFNSKTPMNVSFLQRASNKNSLKLRLKSVENFSRGTRQLKFSALRKIILEFVWELLTFFVTFLGQAKKVKKFKILTMHSFASNLIYSIILNNEVLIK
jgi:hypothetical protein